MVYYTILVLGWANEKIDLIVESKKNMTEDGVGTIDSCNRDGNNNPNIIIIFL